MNKELDNMNAKAAMTAAQLAAAEEEEARRFERERKDWYRKEIEEQMK